MIKPQPPEAAGPSTPGPPVPRFPRWLLLALLAAVALQSFTVWQDAGETRRVSYSELRNGIAAGRFSSVEIGEETLTGTLRQDQTEAAGEKDVADDGADQQAPDRTDGEGDAEAQDVERWLAARVPNDESLIPLLEQHEVEYSYAPSSDMMIWLLWGIAGLFLLSLLLRRAATGPAMGPQNILSVGKSKARVQVEPDTGVTFDDVAGVDEAIDELQELVSFLKEPEEYERIGARIPKGVLLVGPPGTGKTLLARAVAGHAGVPFFSLSGSEFMEMFVGVGAARVRDLFAQAAQREPAIIFIDELDALAKSRGGGPMFGGHDEREQTLNQLLSEMDGFDPRRRVIVLAATNRPEVLDAALLRPGRFDRQILVDKPSRAGRREILDIHTERVQLDGDVDLDKVAVRSSGMAGADLANIVNEAALLAVRRGAKRVAQGDFDEAIERVMAGLRRKGFRLNDEDKRRVACHEAGHAVVSLACAHADPVHKVSIVSRGPGALGYTLQLPAEDRALMGEPELLDRLAVLLGGRAAETVFLGSLSTGAADDLRKATELARAMVVEYGMSPALGPIFLRQGHRSVFLPSDGAGSGGSDLSDHTARRVDDEIGRLVHEAERRAHDRLNANRSLHEALVGRLIDDDVVGQDELEELAQRHRVVVDSPDENVPQADSGEYPAVSS